MSAEVGLLSRNVVVQGDDQTYDIQFGAHILLSSPGDESLLGRFSNAEFRMMGQGFFLGRYAIHFHLVGSVQGSFVRKCAVHHSFNRAVAIHGVNNLQVIRAGGYLSAVAQGGGVLETQPDHIFYPNTAPRMQHR